MACCLAAPSLFGAKPLPEQVEGPVIWNVMTAMLRYCKTMLQNAISILQMIDPHWESVGVSSAISQGMLLNKQSSDWWFETSWRSCGVIVTTPFRYYKWLSLQWDSVEVSLVQVMACRLFGAKPLPEPVKGPVIWNAKTTMLHPCNNSAVITTRAVFIQIAKCADRRAHTIGHAGSETCFVWNTLTVVLILVFWSCSSQWPQGTRSAGPIGRLWVGAGYPNQETKWRWSDHRSHQRRYAISSTHLNDQWHIWIHLFLTDGICNGKSFQILVHPYIFCYLYSKHKAMFGEIW